MEPDVSPLARSLVVLLCAMNRSSTLPLRRHAGGTLARALDEAETLLEAAGEDGRGELVRRLGGPVLRPGLPDGRIHESWLLDALGKLPGPLLGGLLSTFPPVLMRHVAGLLEERRGFSFGKITLKEISPPAARALASGFLPPAGGTLKPEIYPKALTDDPPRFLADHLFDLDLDSAKEPLAGLVRRAGDEMRGIVEARTARSLVCAALALCGRPAEATSLALRMPRRTGRVFLELSRLSSLFAGEEEADRWYALFRDHVSM
jgi:hypothetical protein